jgi:hypothetical protein
VIEQIRDRLAQAGVRLHSPFLELVRQARSAAFPLPARYAPGGSGGAVRGTDPAPKPDHRIRRPRPEFPARTGSSGKFGVTSTKFRRPWAKQLASSVFSGSATLERVAHLNGSQQVCGPLLQHLGQVLAGVLAPGKKQRDPAPLEDPYDPAG